MSDPAFTWSGASDSGSGVKGYYWYFGTDPNADPTIWTTSAGCDPSAVTPGTYYLRVKTEDNVGNQNSPVTLFTFKYDATPPTGEIVINSGAACTNSPSVTLTLSCSDDQGCSQMQFSNDGSSYSDPEAYATSKAWTLAADSNGTKTVYVKFKDTAGNWSNSVPPDTIVLNSPVIIARTPNTPYTSLQSAYNAAIDGDVIKCQGIQFIESLTVNRNIEVTLQGGYDCEFTTYTGNVTSIKGMITTTVGGGKITIRNFVLEQ